MVSQKFAIINRALAVDREEVEGSLFVMEKDYIERQAIENVLAAQKRIANTGDAKEVARITKLLLSLLKKRKDVLVDVISENSQERD